jgi:transposase-like protein
MNTSEKKGRRKFTPAFRVQAVARELGIGESLLHNGVARHRLTESTGALQAS